MTSVYILADGGTTLLWTDQFSRHFVDRVKALPPGQRAWDPERKLWKITAPLKSRLVHTLIRDLEDLGAWCRLVAEEPEEPDESSPETSWADMVFTRLGPDRAVAAFRALSRVCHPDTGGTHELFLELEQAYRQAGAA